MKIIIAGGRNYDVPYEDFESSVISFLVLNDLYHREGVTEVIHGCCPTGADALAQEFIEQYDLTASHFPAQWDLHGKSAGPIRNSEMVASGADLLIAFHDGKSRGTGDIIQKAERAGLLTHIVRY